MQENNKRIAKNTLMLYFRMMLIMGVSLYTSRVVLEVLGVEDFGIYNIVGGIVVMFGFLNSAMSTATQRFLSFELGRKDYEQLKKVFSLSVTIHALIAVVIFILAETIGLWFLNTQLTIPTARMEAANWVYQFSIFAFMVNVMAVPYNAAIVSHERMNVYAYVSIIEVILKLAIVFILQYFGFDKLKLYAILVFVVSFIVRMVYQIYCKRKFKECTYRFVWDKKLFKELTSFSGWNLFGGIVSVANTQGENILLNIFFGPVVNAARGIAVQVNGAISQFAGNFMMATRPQITKNYANGDYQTFVSLIFQSAKFSFFLMLLLATPILIQTSYILELWLRTPPEYSVIFCQLTIVASLINCISAPLMTAAQASGNLKRYIGGLAPVTLLNSPVSFLFLKLGFDPVAVYLINVSIEFIAFFRRLYLVSRITPIKFWFFIKDVVVRCWLISALSLTPLFFLSSLITPSIYSFVLLTLFSLAVTGLIVYYVGMNQIERAFMMNTIKTTIKRK